MPVRGFGQTSRPKTWWVVPVLTFIGLGTVVVYATWAAFQGNNYRFGPYLSPFYSPEIFGGAHSWFGGSRRGGRGLCRGHRHCLSCGRRGGFG